MSLWLCSVQESAAQNGLSPVATCVCQTRVNAHTILSIGFTDGGRDGDVLRVSAV